MPVQLSHLQTVGRRNWDKMDMVLALVDRALDMGIDAYPYLADSCSLTQLLPVWALEGGTAALRARLAEASTRHRIADQTEANMGNDWEDILVSTLPGRDDLVGRTIRDIADGRGEACVDTALDLLLENKGRVQIISFNQSEENLRKVVSHPCTSVITNGLVIEGKPHPRTFGTYPTFLGQYVRDRG